MRSKQEKLLSVISVMLFLLVFLSPFVSKAILGALGYDCDKVPIVVIVMMVCSVILGTMSVFNKEPVVTRISAVTCTVGAVCVLILGFQITTFFELKWVYVFLCGYLFLLFIVLASILGKKTGKQKVFKVIQKIIVALLFVNISANIYRAASETYGFWGIFWDLIYFEIAMVLNSLASFVWGMWFIAHSKDADE